VYPCQTRATRGEWGYHHAAYRCNRRARENNHDRTQIERCRNSEISTNILEGHVFEMIRETMLNPGNRHRGDTLQLVPESRIGSDGVAGTGICRPRNVVVVGS
jgi:hypothetical protein